MDYQKLSEKNLDEIMVEIRRINGKSISGDAETVNNFNSEEVYTDACLTDADYCIDQAVLGTQIGLRKAPMYEKKGLARKIARVIELIYLRIAELTNRDLRDYSASVVQALRILRSRIERLFCNDQVLERRIEKLHAEMTGNSASQAATQAALEEKLASQAAAQAALEEKLTSLAAIQTALEGRLSSQATSQAVVEEKLASHAAYQASLNEMLISHTSYQAVLNERINALSETQSKDKASAADMADKLRYISKRIGAMESHAIPEPVAAESRPVLPAAGADMSADVSMFYHDFEERFRGSQDDILHRLSVYKDVLTGLLGSFENKTFVDLGCGRGEMLDFICANGGSDCVGVDINPLQLDICAEKGHKVIQMDCIAYLRGLESGSVDMVSAIQLVEHLSFESLVVLLEECARVVRKGGVILMETPNCNNLLVASTWFYVDPTHRHPLHPELLRFMAERSGFGNVQIVGANSNIYAKKLEMLKEESASDSTINRNYEMLNNLLYGDQDYALIGVKQ